MDRHVPPRVAYWTNAFEPRMEAIAAEVALLRRHFPGSTTWGLHPSRWVLLSRERGFGLNPRLHLVFRAITRTLEPLFQLNHIVGTTADWFYLRAARRRPTVMTVVAADQPADIDLLQGVEQFAVEFPAGRDELEQHGVSRDRVRLIFPPVDLTRFRPAPAPDGPFTVLFASSPDREDWLAARGVPQLLDAAALRPDVRFRLIWRPWGNSEGRVRQWIAERGLRNVELLVGCWKDMAGHYRRAHVTAAPFTDGTRSKAAPNSLVESLACGRPVLLTETVGLAELVRDADAGQVSAATGEALAEHLDRLRAGWDRYSRNARRLAERWFGQERFLAAYRQLYDEVLSRPARVPTTDRGPKTRGADRTGRPALAGTAVTG
jgi:glycosyltransferase involved in cell wall biosynthesis